jgi:photosystem II stability/assembly factor-like uncharacterized protein
MKKILSLAAVCAGFFLFAQESIDPKLIEQMKFRNIGPAGMSGRVASIDVDPTDDGRIFVGAASGGLWLSENGGQSWTCIFNNEKAASIGAVKIDPKNPSLIWVGTGEGNPRNSQTSGNGIYKSMDAGKSWRHMGLEDTKNIYRVVIDPRNSDVVYAAAIGVAWGEGEARGVYKTTDGGETWEKILYVDEKTGAADLVIDPKNPNKLIATMWEYRRWPWFFKSGGPGSGMYVTHDGGKNWVKRTDEDGLPKGDLGRIGVAISPSDPDVVYALVESKGKNAIYRSNDGGFKWNKVSTDGQIGNRPFYYSEIYVSPDNPNKVYSLWTLLTMSEDGGKSWKTIAPYSSVHPDHQSFWVGKDPDYLIEGNDGGLNISRDGGKSWRFVENLPLAQFYHIRVDNQIPYNVYGGMQDNGSWKGPAYVWHSGGIRNSDWKELYFGDGFDVVPDPEDPRYVYAQSQEGNVARVDIESGYAQLIKPVHPDGERLRFNWNAAIAQDPFDASTIYFGSQYVHKSIDKGDSWQIISTDLTTNDTAYQKQLESGGLTYDVTGAENFTTIISIVPSPIKKDVLWVGTDDGQLHVTQDGGENWTEVSGNIKGMPKGAWIPHIHVSNHKEGEAFVVVNDYRRNNWKPFLYHTSDFGKSFRSLIPEDQIEGYTMSVVQDPVEENLLFLGTEFHLYYSLDKGANWTKWGKDFPTVQVADLAIQEREGDLIAGTFGRAAWVLDDIRPLRALAADKEDIMQRPIKVFPAPDAYMVSWRQADGTRFAADAMYRGENRTSSARISFWLNKNEKDTAYKKVKKVQVTILNENNEQLRTYQRKFENGLNRITWDLREKGTRWPSLQEPDKDADKNEPGGVSVLPGTYNIVITYGPSSDTASIIVHPDPRLNISLIDLEANQQLNREMEAQIAKVSRVAAEMRKAKKSIDAIEKQLKDKKGDDWKEAKEQLKAVKDSFEVVRLAIYGKEDVKGYYEQPETWMSVVGTTRYALGSKRGAIGPNGQNQFAILKQKTDEVVTLANKFFKEDWPVFKTFFEENPISLLAELEPIENEQP